MHTAEAGQAQPRRERRKPSGAGASRQRVIDAAIACILEQGLYRASSNAIAEQAGLSWGVIQYYFGNRESLMLAVLEEGARRLEVAVRDTAISGGTLRERVSSYMDILAAYYGSPYYLVFTQVLISLSHDPKTTEKTLRTLRGIAAEAQPPLRSLQEQVLGDARPRHPEVQSLLFHSLRGLALSHVMLGAVPSSDPSEVSREFPAQRALLAEALSLLIEQETGDGEAAATGRSA
jgi:AcrR family transcriptional regulator